MHWRFDRVGSGGAARGLSHFAAPHVELLNPQPHILGSLAPGPNLHQILRQGKDASALSTLHAASRN